VSNAKTIILISFAGLAGYAFMNRRELGVGTLSPIVVTARRKELPMPELVDIEVTAKRKPVPRQSRGIRNNNPGNIEWSKYNDWTGQVGSDGRYCVFSAPVYGIRAMSKILDSYRRRGIETVGEIIATWAPSFENDTGSYIKSVVTRSGLTDSWEVSRQDYPAMIEAIIYHENGSQPYPVSLIDEGVSIA
jgi:hypothetical protein